MRRYVGLLLVLSCAPAASSCIDDGASMRVECNLKPDDNCNFEASDAPTCVATGVLDLTVASSYVMVLQVRNALFSRRQEIPVQAEPNGMQVTGATVTLRNTAGQPLDFGPNLPNPFSIVATGYVGPDSAGAVTFVPIPAGYVQFMNANSFELNVGTVVVALKVQGITDGGVEVESAEWLWPVTVVRGTRICRDATTNDASDKTLCLPGQDGNELPFCSELGG